MSTALNPTAGAIRKKVLIQASPTRIYKALTSARDLVHWFCDRVTCDARLGGELTAVWRLGHGYKKGRGVFRKLVPDSMVEIEWKDVGDPDRPESARRVFVYSITAGKGSSQVTLLDEDYPLRDDETFADLDEGWNYVLQDFKDLCERKERASRRLPGRKT